MMPKGLFTHAACVLLSGVPREAEAVLARFTPRPVEPGSSWEWGGPGWLMSYRGGTLVVDLVERPWPDSMGDPQAEPRLFAAWSMGQFGPFTFPGSLERAAQHCYTWKEGAERAAAHRAFLRLRVTYAGGPEEPVIPPDYDSLHELEFATDVALALLDLPEALAYFNPGGEVLSFAQDMRAARQHYRSNGFPPVDLWTNVRMFQVGDGWMLMDTVGLSQLELPDVEVCFHADDADGTEMARFLRNTSLYLAQKGDVIKNGDTLDGPKARLKNQTCAEALVMPPRPTLRFRPERSARPLPPDFGFVAPKKFLGLF